MYQPFSPVIKQPFVVLVAIATITGALPASAVTLSPNPPTGSAAFSHLADPMGGSYTDLRWLEQRSSTSL